MPEEKLYYWPLVPREMLEDAKENRDMNAGHALGGVGAEMPATGILADKQPATHRQAYAGTHTHSIRHQGKSRVFFHSIFQLAAFEVLCKHQLMKVKAHRVIILQGTKGAQFLFYGQKSERLKALLSINSSAFKCTVISYSTFPGELAPCSS